MLFTMTVSAKDAALCNLLLQNSYAAAPIVSADIELLVMRIDMMKL